MCAAKKTARGRPGRWGGAGAWYTHSLGESDDGTVYKAARRTTLVVAQPAVARETMLPLLTMRANQRRVRVHVRVRVPPCQCVVVLRSDATLEYLVEALRKKKVPTTNQQVVAEDGSVLKTSDRLTPSGKDTTVSVEPANATTETNDTVESSHTTPLRYEKGELVWYCKSGEPCVAARVGT